MANQLPTISALSESDIDNMSSTLLIQLALGQNLALPDSFFDKDLDGQKMLVKSVLFEAELDPADTEEEDASVKQVLPATAPTTSIMPPSKQLAAPTTPSGTPSEDPFWLPEIEFTKLQEEGDAVELVHQLVGVGDYALYHLGGVFYRMSEMGWYMGHGDFATACEQEFNVRYRKAAYLMKIYKTLTEKDVDWKTVSSIGWSKLKEILPVITKENAADWAAKAATMSTLTLIDQVKQTIMGGEVTAPSQVKKMNFALYPDQHEVVSTAIADAKEKAHTDVQSVALELICQQYLADPSVSNYVDNIGIATPASVQQYFKAKGATPDTFKELTEILDKLFPELNVYVDDPANILGNSGK